MTYVIRNDSGLDGVRHISGALPNIPDPSKHNCYRIETSDGRHGHVYPVDPFMPGRTVFGGLFRFNWGEQEVEIAGIKPAKHDPGSRALHNDVVDDLSELEIEIYYVRDGVPRMLHWTDVKSAAREMGIATDYTKEGRLDPQGVNPGRTDALYGKLHYRAWPGNPGVELYLKVTFDDLANGEPWPLDAIWLRCKEEIDTPDRVVNGIDKWQDGDGSWWLSYPMAVDPRYGKRMAQPKTNVLVHDGYILCGDRDNTKTVRTAYRIGGKNRILERERDKRILFSPAKWAGQTVNDEPWSDLVMSSEGSVAPTGRKWRPGTRFDKPKHGPREDPSAPGDDDVFGVLTADELDARNAPEVALSVRHDALFQYSIRAGFPLRADAGPEFGMPVIYDYDEYPNDNTQYEVWPDRRRPHTRMTVNRSNSCHYLTSTGPVAYQWPDEEHERTYVPEVLEYFGDVALQYLARDLVERALHYVRRGYPHMPHGRAIGRTLTEWAALYAVTGDERLKAARDDFFRVAIAPDWEPRRHPDAWLKPVHLMNYGLPQGVIGPWHEAKVAWGVLAWLRVDPDGVTPFMREVGLASALTCVRTMVGRQSVYVLEYDWGSEPVAIPEALLRDSWGWETVAGVQAYILLGGDGPDLAKAQAIMRDWPRPQTSDQASRLIEPVT